MSRLGTDVDHLHARPSKSWTIPPRLKPGRKPTVDVQESSCDKKSVNREAQRAFRERRTERVKELEERVRSLEAGQVERDVAVQRAARRTLWENKVLRQAEVQAVSERDALKRERDALVVTLQERERVIGRLERELVHVRTEGRGGVAVRTSSLGPSLLHPETASLLARPPVWTAPTSAVDSALFCGLCQGESRCACQEAVDEIEAGVGPGGAGTAEASRWPAVQAAVPLRKRAKVESGRPKLWQEEEEVVEGDCPCCPTVSSRTFCQGLRTTLSKCASDPCARCPFRHGGPAEGVFGAAAATTGTRTTACCGDRRLCSAMGVDCQEETQEATPPTTRTRPLECNEAWSALRALVDVSSEAVDPVWLSRMMSGGQGKG